MKNAVVIVLTILNIALIFPVLSIEEAFCAGVGYSNYTKKGQGLISMGASSVFAHPLNTIWAANVFDRNVISLNERISLKITSVQQRLPNGAVENMKGWLYLYIKKLSGHFAALAVWTMTDIKEPFGEFVYLPRKYNDCDVWRGSNNFLPCSAVPIDTPLNPNMFLYTDQDVRKIDEFHLLWRASVSYCNKPKQFRFVFAFNSKVWDPYNSVAEFLVQHGVQNENGVRRALGPLVLTTSYIRPKFYGAATPLWDETNLNCKSTAYAVEQSPPYWFRGAPNKTGFGILTEVERLYHQERWNYMSARENLTATTLKSTCKARASGFTDFGGRCDRKIDPSSKFRTFASDTSTPQCSPNLTVFNNYEINYVFTNGKFEDAVNHRISMINHTNCDCPLIPTVAEVQQVARQDPVLSRSIRDLPGAETQEYGGWGSVCTAKNKSLDLDALGICVVSAAGQLSYGAREWHAVSTLFCSLVIFPVQIFIARYFKGHIPMGPQDGKPYLPVKLWYSVHIILTVPLICLLLSGMAAIVRQRLVLGHSLTSSATFHRVIGYLYFAVILFEMCSGSVRPITIRHRKIAMYTHWGTGVVLNYGGILICILTYLIPASPTSRVVHINKSEFFPIYNHPAPILFIVWIVLDMAVHVFMTVHMIRFDKKLGIKRPYFPILLPDIEDNRELILEHAFKDEITFLKRSIGVYVAFCVLVYLLAYVLIIVLHNYYGLGFGSMSCTHGYNGSMLVPSGVNDVANADLLKFYDENNCEFVFVS